MRHRVLWYRGNITPNIKKNIKTPQHEKHILPHDLGLSPTHFVPKIPELGLHLQSDEHRKQVGTMTKGSPTTVLHQLGKQLLGQILHIVGVTMTHRWVMESEEVVGYPNSFSPPVVARWVKESKRRWGWMKQKSFLKKPIDKPWHHEIENWGLPVFLGHRCRVENFSSLEGLGNFRQKFPEKMEISGNIWKYLEMSENMWEFSVNWSGFHGEMAAKQKKCKTKSLSGSLFGFIGLRRQAL